MLLHIFCMVMPSMSQWLCNFDKWRHCKLVVCIRHLISLHQQSSKWTSIPSVLYLSPNLWNVTHNSHYNECRAMDTSLYDPMRFVSFVLSFIFLFGLFCFPPALHLLQWNLPTDDSVPYVIHLVACAVRSVWHLIDYYHYGTKSDHTGSTMGSNAILTDDNNNSW